MTRAHMADLSGLAANLLAAKRTDVPVDGRRLMVHADLRLGTGASPPARGSGAVPDWTSATPRVLTGPDGQHAVRQRNRLAASSRASIRGRRTRPYGHRCLGGVATGRGVWESRPFVIPGFTASQPVQPSHAAFIEAGKAAPALTAESVSGVVLIRMDGTGRSWN